MGGWGRRENNIQQGYPGLPAQRAGAPPPPNRGEEGVGI